MVDGLWTYVGNKGKKGLPKEGGYRGVLRCTLIETQRRLPAARGIANSETEAAIEAFEQLKSSSRGHPHSPPPLVSDGWGGYDEAMVVEVWGRCQSIEGGDGLRPRRSAPKRSGSTYRWSSSEKVVGG